MNKVCLSTNNFNILDIFISEKNVYFDPKTISGVLIEDKNVIKQAKRALPQIGHFRIYNSIEEAICDSIDSFIIYYDNKDTLFDFDYEKLIEEYQKKCELHRIPVIIEKTEKRKYETKNIQPINILIIHNGVFNGAFKIALDIRSFFADNGLVVNVFTDFLDKRIWSGTNIINIKSILENKDSYSKIKEFNTFFYKKSVENNASINVVCCRSSITDFININENWSDYRTISAALSPDYSVLSLTSGLYSIRELEKVIQISEAVTNTTIDDIIWNNYCLSPEGKIIRVNNDFLNNTKNRYQLKIKRPILMYNEKGIEELINRIRIKYDKSIWAYDLVF